YAAAAQPGPAAGRCFLKDSPEQPNASYSHFSWQYEYVRANRPSMDRKDHRNAAPSSRCVKYAARAGTRGGSDFADVGRTRAGSDRRVGWGDRAVPVGQRERGAIVWALP